MDALPAFGGFTCRTVHDDKLRLNPLKGEEQMLAPKHSGGSCHTHTYTGHKNWLE